MQQMQIKPQHLALHRYFLRASRNRSLFLKKLQLDQVDHLHTRVHLDLWYACLFVVVEGFRKEKIHVQRATNLLRDAKKLALLREFRNSVLHYSPEYTDERELKLFEEADFVEWVNALHDAISDFFLQPANESPTADVTPR